MKLGTYLQSVRQSRRMTLRQVEEGTGRAVSNGYLSQVETGKIARPSPAILLSLAKVYGVDYLRLMEVAGYIPDGARLTPKPTALGELKLTPGEEQELLEYLQFMRLRAMRAAPTPAPETVNAPETRTAGETR